jgi:hypothetical protein
MHATWTRSATTPVPTAATRVRWASLLFVGGALAVVAGLALGDARPLLQADADLAWLLRGMAGIKALIVAAAMAAIVWRLRRPAPAALAAACVGAACAMALATALIWQLSHIVAASLLFHAAEITLLVLAWRDGLAAPWRGRRAAR